MTHRVRRSPNGNRIGESHPRARLSDDDVSLMRELHEQHDVSYRELGEKFDTPYRSVRDICQYRRRVT